MGKMNSATMAKFWTKIRETKRWIVILNLIVGMEWLQIYITTHKNDLNSWSEIIKICKKKPLFMTPPPHVNQIHGWNIILMKSLVLRQSRNS